MKKKKEEIREYLRKSLAELKKALELQGFHIRITEEKKISVKKRNLGYIG